MFLTATCCCVTAICYCVTAYLANERRIFKDSSVKCEMDACNMKQRYSFCQRFLQDRAGGLWYHKRQFYFKVTLFCLYSVKCFGIIFSVVIFPQIVSSDHSWKNSFQESFEKESQMDTLDIVKKDLFVSTRYFPQSIKLLWKIKYNVTTCLNAFFF